MHLLYCRFVTSIREQCPHFLDPEESFVVKLPFSDCGHYAGAKMAVKHSKGGVAGICNSLREFVTGEYCQHIIGVIPYVILQPDILTNTVAEVRHS
jgi:hypothetical protein